MTGLCAAPVQTAEKLPGRALPAVQMTVTQTVTTEQIYETFQAACGRCHQGEPRSSNGSFVLNSAADLVKDETAGGLGKNALDRLKSSDPKVVMPPTRGALGTIQPPDGDEQALLDLLQQWLDSGRKDDGFTTTTDAKPPFFRYSEDLRASFTNLGSCVPQPAIVGCAQAQMQKMDKKFDQVRSFADLPTRLEETDLFTLDSAELAQNGVISYAPTYTLFSDGAKKMRYLRVPLGQKIHYDAGKNDFVIPPGTRFYKTFLRAVIDKDGNHSYRKLETRIIVARPDDTAADGTATRRVVFGTYKWSLDEARAELVQDPYRDRTPFRDLALRHVTDEQRALKNGFDPDTDDGINDALAADDQLRAFSPTAELDDTLLLTRGYAVPGRDRCIQCHMGSSSQSYILGFNPYQVDRRRPGCGGVFDDPPYGEAEWNPGEDELSQLDRLVSYGVLDGVPAPTTPDPSVASANCKGNANTVFRLEESQLDGQDASQSRPPRNDHELEAQAYMMGNCAFCHNPRGFPSIQNPSLKSVLNFLPFSVGEGKGGIFQFDIQKVSPRTSRTAAYNVQFPYVVPSLFERYDPNNVGNDLVPKHFTTTGSEVYVAAPWRALLFRNVGTPFTYSSDDAIHPHMPLNVAGYDQRVPLIMGDWMLSIPARLKAGAINSEAFTALGGVDMAQPWDAVSPTDPDYAAYQRVGEMRVQAFHSDRAWAYNAPPKSTAPDAPKVDDTSYETACVNSGVPNDCKDQIPGAHAYIGGALFHPDASDVVAPEMRAPNPPEAPEDIDFKIALLQNAAAKVTRAGGQQQLPSGCSAGQLDACENAVHGVGLDKAVIEGLTPNDTASATAWKDLIPDRPNWLLRDLTIPPGAWVPRRANWADAFTNEDVFLPPVLDLSALNSSERQTQEAAQEQRRDLARRVYPLLTQFKISENLFDFATTEQPYGLWAQPANGKTADGEQQQCDSLLGPNAASPSKRVGDFQSNPPGWFAVSQLDPTLAADAQRPVYMELPGESIFNLVCINCHGKDADANSLLANTILELTGGRTRVADLRDGLFGNQGANRADVFPGASFPSETTDTMTVRYLLWMGLGGTEATIPSVVLNRVGATRPLGVDRVVNPNAQPTPNMLANAVGFCQDSLGLRRPFDYDPKTGKNAPGLIDWDGSKHFDGSARYPIDWESSLVGSNGDAELWVKLCSLDNTPPIRTIAFDVQARQDSPAFYVNSAYWRDAGDGVSVVPADASFGDQRGKVAKGLSADNVIPWCLERDPPSATGFVSPEDKAAYLPNLTKAWHAVPGREHEDPPICPDELYLTTGTGELNPTKGPGGVANLLQVPPLNIADQRRDSWATRGAMNVGASVFLYLDGVTGGHLARPDGTGSVANFTRKPGFDECALPKSP